MWPFSNTKEKIEAMDIVRLSIKKMREGPNTWTEFYRLYGGEYWIKHLTVEAFDFMVVKLLDEMTDVTIRAQKMIDQMEKLKEGLQNGQDGA